MKRTITKLFLGTAFAVLAAPAIAVPIVGIGNPTDNTGEFTYSVVNAFELQVDLANTSNYDARITGFGFDLTDGIAAALLSVSGTLNNGDWSFSFDAIPGPDDRDAFAITGANLNGGDPLSGIRVGQTGIFSFLGLFSSELTIDNILVRFQRTGADGEGSDRGVACTTGCTPPPTSVPEPSSLLLMGLGLALFGTGTLRRRNRASR